MGEQGQLFRAPRKPAKLPALKPERDLFGADPQLPPKPLPPELPDARMECWRAGIDILRGLTGKAPKSCRSIMGKLLKLAHDDVPAVMQILHDAMDLRPISPLDWIMGAIRNRYDTGRQSETAKLREQWGLGSMLDVD